MFHQVQSVIVEHIEKDEKTFRAAGLARLQGDGVIRPVRGAAVDIGGKAIGDLCGLLIESVGGAPSTVEDVPTIRTFMAEIALIKRHAIAGHDDISVLHRRVPRADADRSMNSEMAEFVAVTTVVGNTVLPRF